MDEMDYKSIILKDKVYTVKELHSILTDIIDRGLSHLTIKVNSYDSFEVEEYKFFHSFEEYDHIIYLNGYNINYN